MKSKAFKMYLKPGMEEEYRRRHAEIWPELIHQLREEGVYDYSIFLDRATDTLFAVQKTRGAFLRVGGSVGGKHQKPPLSGGDRRAASFLADGEHPALPGETEILRCLIHRPPPVPP